MTSSTIVHTAAAIHTYHISLKGMLHINQVSLDKKGYNGLVR